MPRPTTPPAPLPRARLLGAARRRGFARPIRMVPALSIVLVLLGGSGGKVVSGRPEIAVEFEVLENLSGGETRFRAAFTLENRGSTTLGADGWALYFNFLPVPDPDGIDTGVTFSRVNGDLRRLAPGPGFEPLEPGASRRVTFTAPGWLIKESDAPAGLYFVFDEDFVSDEAPARAVAVTEHSIVPIRPDQARRTAADLVLVPTPATRFAANARLESPAAPLVPILPTPVVFEPGAGRLALEGEPRIGHAPELAKEAAHLATALGGRVAGGGQAPIRLVVAEIDVGGVPRRAGDEAYRLIVDAEAGVEIVGSDRAGVFYGIQSLRALLPAEGASADGPLSIPEVRVEDAPRFGYRGLHLDVARNFQSRETVKKLLDLAAFYKLNRFHFHLTDDEGWRLEIRGLPELVEVGGRRGHTRDGLDRLPPSFGSGPEPTGSHGSGHYTRADFVEILRHASDRHIEVVPEIDVPGHARAAIRSMAARGASEYLLSDPEDRSEYRSVQGWDDNVVDVCLPSTYRFLERVVDEVVALYAEAGAPLTMIHTGGDEVPAGVWEKSPACARLIETDDAVGSTADLPGYFLKRFGDILAARGLATAGWEEIALVEEHSGERTVKKVSPAALDRGFRPYVWNNVWGWGSEDLGYRLANAGFEVVMCNATNLYFDLAYDKHPLEPGYTWAGFVDTRAAWEFAPFDVYVNATRDRLGQPIDPGTFAGRARLTEKGRRSILGIQGQVWGENAKGRSKMEYLAFPKLLGLAERAWAARPEWVTESDPRERERKMAAAWSDFAHRLGQRELPRLDRLHGGVDYRLPPPGAVVEDGRLSANVAFPGLAIRYTIDGGEPTADSALFEGPVPVDGEIVRLRTFDRRGRGSRVATVVIPPRR